MHVSKEVAEIINTVFTMAKDAHYEYVTPELLLYVVCNNKFLQKHLRTAVEVSKSYQIISKTISVNIWKHHKMTATRNFLKEWERFCPMHGSLLRAVEKR